MTKDTHTMLDVYDEQSDQRSFSLDETSSTEESPKHARLSLVTPNDANPYVGQRFATHDAAYDFYSEFAKGGGFSIRRHRTEGKDGVGRGITRRYFVCHRAGNTPIKVSTETKPQRNRKSSRCGCQAYMRISRSSETGISEWRVTGYANHHNHELLEPNQVRFLPAYRTISDTDKNRILMFAKTGISVQQMLRLMELEKCVEPGYLPFTEKDVRNLIQSFRKVDQDEQNIDLLKICRDLKEKDPNFKYEFTTDFNGRLENIAWSYASSVQSYDIFGDAVVFDTTRRLNAVDMSLGIWVGMNNYGMPCLFGCALLCEENIRSFSWALKVFLKFMNGKAPQTILTDQNMCLKEAIEIEMPTTKHTLCIWLVMAKFPSWFNAVLGERYNDWKTEFYRLYNLENIEDFEHGWRAMIDTFGLHTNRHITNLFTFRTLWALPFLRSHFFAGMTTSELAKAINAFIQRFLNSQTQLAYFIEQVSTVRRLIKFGYHCCGLQRPSNRTANYAAKPAEHLLENWFPLEEHAASILTPYAFSKLQDELVMAAHYASFPVEDSYFLIRHHTKMDGARKVVWIPREEILSCSCHMFEFSGILCRHALRVLSTINCFQAPDRYLPLRWRRANSLPSKPSPGAGPLEQNERIQALQSMTSLLVSEASKSKERLDLACEEISQLLSRIRGLPGSVLVLKNGVHRMEDDLPKHSEMWDMEVS